MTECISKNSVGCVLLLFVCRILNKLTPEKFDKLSLELLNVGIDNSVILKGVILLVSTTAAVLFVSMHAGIGPAYPYELFVFFTFIDLNMIRFCLIIYELDP